MHFLKWAEKWGVSRAAIDDLLAEVDIHRAAGGSQNESGVQASIRLAASQRGWRLFRNNIGAGKLENGSFVRWGLANESERVNQHVKSGDLIGIRPIIITPTHIGTLIGQFVSVECKREGWRINTNNERERAQLKWATIINALGGHAIITNGELK